MASRPFQYAAIFLTCFIDVLGFGIVIPVLPLYAKHFSASDFQLGCLVGVFSLMQFFFAPVWGKVSDRIGRKPVLLIGLVGTVVGYILMGFAGSVLMLFLGRMIDGVSGANIGAAQAYLADISTPENRAKAMGLLGAAFGLGFVFGPALGGWASVKFGFASPMFIAAALSAINFGFVLFLLPESRKPGAVPNREKLFPNLLQHIDRLVFPRVVITYFLVITGFSMTTTIFALLLLNRYGMDALHTGYILAGMGFIGVIIQGGLIGRLVRLFGEGRLALSGAICMGLGMLGLAFSREWGAMFVASALIGIGNSLLLPTLSAMSSRSADADWQGRALGVMQSSGSLARFVGPLLAGALLSLQPANMGVRYGFWTLIVATVVLVAASVSVSGLRGFAGRVADSGAGGRK